MEITIILPCAGEGKRLGLPFPKELAPISPGRTVIDSSLDIIEKSSVDKRILLIDDGNREVTRRYIQERLPEVPLAMVRQHRYAPDMPEAVIRAAPWLGDTNILMLPDLIYEPNGDPLCQLAEVARESGFAMAVAEMPRQRLKAGGAVSVVGGTVKAYEDKPGSPEDYHAAWGMLGFHGGMGMLGMQVVADCTAKVRAAKEPVLGAPVIWLNGWRDCGTWDGYLSEIVSNVPGKRLEASVPESEGI
jgi:CTP:molybdopterin cytidylyltransferase MocA